MTAMPPLLMYAEGRKPRPRRAPYHYWADDELNITVSGWRQGLNARGIAALLPGRTIGAIHQKIWALDCPRSPSMQHGLQIKRSVAKAIGATHYATGKACKHGHVSPRYTLDGACIVCAREKRHRQAKTNPDAERRIKLKYRSSQGGKARENAYDKLWRAANRDRVNEAQRRCYRKRKAIDPERVLEASRVWKKANPQHRIASENRRRARKRSVDGSYAPADAKRLRLLQGNRCAYCKDSLGRNGHLDHIKPLSKGGSNWPRNLQWLCASCNTRKQAQDPIDFARRGGLLL